MAVSASKAGIVVTLRLPTSAVTVTKAGFVAVARLPTGVIISKAGFVAVLRPGAAAPADDGFVSILW